MITCGSGLDKDLITCWIGCDEELISCWIGQDDEDWIRCWIEHDEDLITCWIRLNENLKRAVINTHYYNSNLIWRTVSRRVDEVIPSDHPRRVASRVIQW